MKLKRVKIENYRAIEKLDLTLDPRLTVFHGANAHGKTSVLSAITGGLGRIPRLLLDLRDNVFPQKDRRCPSKPIKVVLKTADGMEWHYGRGGKLGDLRKMVEGIVRADREGAAPRDLPILAFYDANRAVFEQPQNGEAEAEFPRYAVLQDIFGVRTDFLEFFRWFYDKEDDELRIQKEQGSFDFRLKELDAVRRAVEAMVPSASNLRILKNPLRFVVSVKSEGDVTETLSLDQLSGGYGIVLALAADLARRMAQGNPHLDDPLQSEAVVLIDEVELHLHPAWQQRVLPDLLNTFPKTQFLVSTHSPQVLTTVEPERMIIQLRREDGGGVAAFGAAGHTYGAEAGDVLAVAMGVPERPSGNPFVKKLDSYMDMVAAGRGESEEARGLRSDLDAVSPDDPDLDSADMEIRRQKVMSSLGKSG